MAEDKLKPSEDELLAQELEKMLNQSGLAAPLDEDTEPETEETAKDETVSESDDNESPETIQKASDEVSEEEGVEDTPEEKQAPSEVENKEEELPDLSTRLEALTGQLEPTPEQGSPRDQLKAFETEVRQQAQQLQSFDLASQLPKDPQYYQNGVWVFTMKENELNDYLVSLKDEGKEFLASRIERDYWKAVDLAEAHEADKVAFQQTVHKLKNAQDFVEWTEVREEIKGKLPEVTDQEFQQAAAYIEAAVQRDPAFASTITTKLGKLQAGIQVLQQLGVFDRLKAQLTAQTQQNNPPSALPPDARASSKKVTSKPTGKLPHRLDDVKRMKQSDFNKLSEAEVEELLQATFEA